MRGGLSPLDRSASSLISCHLCEDVVSSRRQLWRASWPGTLVRHHIIPWRCCTFVTSGAGGERVGLQGVQGVPQQHAQAALHQQHTQAALHQPLADASSRCTLTARISSPVRNSPALGTPRTTDQGQVLRPGQGCPYLWCSPVTPAAALTAVC